MNAFEYASPVTMQQAVKLLGARWGDTEILAGGQDLLSLMKDHIVEPKRLVNIKGIKEIAGVRYSAQSGLTVGAVATIQELMDSPVVGKEYPALYYACEGISSPQMRALGTVGGDLLQRPRCWYFRNGFGLLATQGSGKSLVVEGQNKYHAILGTSGPAYFVNPSSLAPALIALSATARIFGPKGFRQLPIEQLFRIPVNESEREHALQANEILAEIIVPPAAGERNATYEVRERQMMDWPLAAASVSLKMAGSQVVTARVALGHVAPVPLRTPEAEKILAGRGVSEATAEEAGKAAVSGAKPLSQNGYKVQLARIAVKRAILRAVNGRG